MSMGPQLTGGSDAGAGPDGVDPRTPAPLAADPTAGESNLEMKEVEGLSLGRIVARRFFRHRAAMVSLFVLVVIILCAFTSIGLHLFSLDTGGWWKYTYDGLYNIENGGAPNANHPFGQDSVGHDMFAGVMRGIQQSLMIVFITGIVSTFIGVTLGAVAGFVGGWVDALLMRLTDMVIIVPLYLIAAIVGHGLGGGGGSATLGVFLGLLVWTSLARLVRGEVLALREREFVEAAKVAGATTFRIIVRHILPNSVGVIIVSATLTMSATILTETAISFLGFGVRSPDVSLGSIIGQYQAAFTTRPWLFWWPGLFIVAIALSINFIGDGLRDAFDPRNKRGLTRRAKRERAEAVEAAAAAEPVAS
jgi:ABC-type dipeptide/oligopeptide/nickel transport system permease subunit